MALSRTEFHWLHTHAASTAPSNVVVTTQSDDRGSGGRQAAFRAGSCITGENPVVIQIKGTLPE